MSGLYLLLLLAIWLGLGYGGYRLWRRHEPQWKDKKQLYIAIGATAAAVWVLWPFWEVAGKKMYYDAEVNRLCAKDGGVKVYETVKLPVEKFDKYDQINFYRPTQKENALGPDYRYIYKREYLRGTTTGYPVPEKLIVVRTDIRIHRQSDGKLLGETVFYERGGGDLPGPWPPSSFLCPTPSKDNDLIHQVFEKR